MRFNVPCLDGIVIQSLQRINEAEKLGFKFLIVSEATKISKVPKKIKILKYSKIEELIFDKFVYKATILFLGIWVITLLNEETTLLESAEKPLKIGHGSLVT